MQNPSSSFTQSAPSLLSSFGPYQLQTCYGQGHLKLERLLLKQDAFSLLEIIHCRNVQKLSGKEHQLSHVYITNSADLISSESEFYISQTGTRKNHKYDKMMLPTRKARSYRPAGKQSERKMSSTKCAETTTHPTISTRIIESCLRQEGRETGRTSSTQYISISGRGVEI